MSRDRKEVVGMNGPTLLPTFYGYTVDMRLRQFRKMHTDDWPEFINFDEPDGLGLYVVFSFSKCDIER